MAKKKVTHQANGTREEPRQSQNHNTQLATTNGSNTMEEPPKKVENNTHQTTAMDEPRKKVQRNAHQVSATDETSEKVENLKSLNSLLLKETFERRQQVESLVHAKEGLESELSKFRVESELLESELIGKSEENLGLELEKSVFCVFVLAQMGQMAKEKYEIEKVKSERDAEIDLLKREVNELMGSLEHEKGKLSRVCWERDVVKADFDSLAHEANGLRVKVVEMEKKERLIEDEVEKLKSQCQVLVKEKAEKERAVEAVMREKDLAQRKHAESERAMEDLKREIERVVIEKNEIEVERNVQEARLFQFEKEVEHFSNVESNLRKEKEGLHMKVLELEESVDEAIEKEEKMERQIKALVEEKREKEETLEELNEEVKSSKELLDMVTVELEIKEHRIKEIEQMKNEIEEAKLNQQSEIAELSIKGAEQRDVISTLRNSCHEQEEKNEQLVSEVVHYKNAVDSAVQERAEAQKKLDEETKKVEELLRIVSEKEKVIKEAEKNLDEEKKKVEDLRLIVAEKEKLIKETEDELEKSKSVCEEITEKQKVIKSSYESLIKEKDVMQKKIFEAERKIHDWEAKCESEGANLERALTMLKNTAAIVSCESTCKEEAAANDHNLGEQIEAYAAELEAIQSAFRNKEKMIGDLKEQVESLQKLSEAQKRRSFWTLVSSATTLVAAASIAYVKGR